MKISSASKKVLASALSAAMVVAFAPTVAFGAQAGNKITVKYDLAGGVDKGTGQDVLTLSDTQTVGSVTVAGGKYTQAEIDAAKVEQILASTESDVTSAIQGVITNTGLYADGEAVVKAYVANPSAKAFETLKAAVDSKVPFTGDAAATAGADKPGTTTGVAVELADYSNIKLTSGSNSYSIKGWELSYDKNGDGVIDPAEDYNWNGQAFGLTGAAVDVSDSKIPADATITAKAIYDTAALSGDFTIDNDGDADHQYATIAIPTAAAGSMFGTGKVTLTAPDGTTSEAKANGTGADAKVTAAAQAGKWTATLTDGNGVKIGEKSILVGETDFTGAVFTDPFNDALKTPTLKVFYSVATAEAETTYENVLAQRFGSTTASTFLSGAKKSTASDAAAPVAFYDANGKAVAEYKNNAWDFTSANTVKGTAVATATAKYAADAKAILSFTGDDYTLKVATDVNAGTEAATKVDVSNNGKYYVEVKNAAGDVIAQTLDSSKSVSYISLADLASNGKTDVDAGTYTATLYKVTGTNASGVADGDAAIATAVSTKTVEVAGVTAPTWSYAAAEKATDSNAGTLTLANGAGDDYAVYYSFGSDVIVDANGTVTHGTKYDTSKGGIVVSKSNLSSTVYVKAVYTGKDKKALKTSKSVVLTGCTTALSSFKGFYGVSAALPVNGASTVYYNSNADVKATIAAAEKTFTDKGFAAAANGKEWDAAIIVADQSYVDAVGAVAKAEAKKLLEGTTDAKTGDLTKITDQSYNAAVKAIDKVSADFAANHDSDASNNVAGYSDTELSKSYVKAADEALKAAAKAQVKYAKADVDAAAAVTKALKEAKTGANAKAAVEAYGKLTAAQKELVSAADVAAAQDVIAKAELKDAQDEAALAKVKGKTVKAKAKKKTTAKLTVVTSKSGAKSTFKKASGNAKITVSKAGKVTVKKGLKAGKTYTAKVKATVGTQSKTVKVTVKVAK